MIDKIKRLENQASYLEPDLNQKNIWDREVLQYCDRFLREIEEIPVYSPDNGSLEQLYGQPFQENPRDMMQILSIIEQAVDRTGINPAGPGHMGYVPGGGVVPTAYGDYLAAITNRYAGITYANPGAVLTEEMCIQWMAELVGYSHTAVGNLTSGGSIATLIAMVSARDHHGLTPQTIGTAVIYATPQLHHCIHKALRIIGLDHAITRSISMNSAYKMDTDDLERQLTKDRRKGLKPFLVLGSAGSTDTGVVDPLDRIAEIATEYQCWFHIDAAYGGFFLLVEQIQSLFHGIGRSDSIVMDPHKGLFLSYGTGAVLVKDADSVLKSHHYIANYMQDAYAANHSYSPADLSPELTKHYRGLRMWLSLQLFGIAPFRAALEEKILLTQYFYSEVAKLGFTVGPKPQLSVCIFRWIPKDGDPGEFNRVLVEQIQTSGKIFLSSTTIDGVYWLRICVMVFRTHLKHVNLLLDMLAEMTAEK